jgi:hypothetical protein
VGSVQNSHSGIIFPFHEGKILFGLERMELLRLLPELSLEQLLAVAQRDNVRISGHLNPCLIRGDLEKAILEHNPQLPPVLFRDDSPLTPLLANEVGVNPRKVQEAAFDFGIEHGLPVEFLDLTDSQTCLAVFVYPIRERGILTPISVWYDQDDHLVNPFKLSPANFRWLFKAYSDETPDVYIRHHAVELKYVGSLEGPLTYQPMEVLLDLARNLPAPSGAIYFETKVGLIEYLSNESAVSPFGSIDQRKTVNNDYIRKRLTQLWENAYPGRRANLNRYERIPLRDIYYIPSKMSALLVPPSRLEQVFFEITAQQKGDYYKTRIEIPKIYRTPLDIQEEDDEGHRVPGYLPYFSLEFVEPNALLSRNELVDIVEANSVRFEQYAEGEIIFASGLLLQYDIGKALLFKKLRLKAIQEHFDLLVRTVDCPNSETTLGDPTVGLGICITFGTLRTFRCYSEDELELALIVDPDRRYVEFRKPENPRDAFNSASSTSTSSFSS